MTENIKFGDKAVFRRPNAVKVCFQLVKNRSNLPALNVDMANNIQQDWTGKETFQLTIDEISLLAAYFLGYTSNVNFAFHGEKNNKSLTVTQKWYDKDKNQKTKMNCYHQVSMWQGGTGLFYINLSHHEGFQIFNLLLNQLQTHYKQSKADILNLLKIYYA